MKHRQFGAWQPNMFRQMFFRSTGVIVPSAGSRAGGRGDPRRRGQPGYQDCNTLCRQNFQRLREHGAEYLGQIALAFLWKRMVARPHSRAAMKSPACPSSYHGGNGSRLRPIVYADGLQQRTIIETVDLGQRGNSTLSKLRHVPTRGMTSALQRLTLR